jgi:hypothetical protein
VDLTVYPNPTAGMVTVIPFGDLASYTVSVYNENGQLVNSFQSAKGLLPAQLDLSSLADGIYFITISTGSQFFASRLVKISSSFD